MGLSGQQRKQLQEALIDAFPTTPSLKQMLAFGLGKNLTEIAGESSLQDIVFKLIEAANSEGWIPNLICAACNNNPDNLQLQSVVQRLIIRTSFDLYSRIQELLKEFGYFELDELGTGTSGATYLAIKGNEQKHIVIKTIKIDLLHQIIKSNNLEFEEFVRAITSFKKEAEILSKFKHPHIVSYNDHLTIPLKFLIKNSQKKLDNNVYLLYEFELLFLVMEYIQGQNLEQLLSGRGTPLQETEALGYILQISDALIQIHNKGVLHRDIKPQNIMVRETTLDAVLIDFGIAREFNSKVTQTHTVAFTQGYAPPEQLEPRCKRGDYTDVYGLAATLYYLLTKAHPADAMLRKSDSSSFVEPKKINPNISDTVNEAILWGMELESHKRPQTVQQWLEKLLSPDYNKSPQTVPQWLTKLLSPLSVVGNVFYNVRGNAYRNKKDYDSAIADYNEALKLDCNDATAYYNRGLAYYQKKDYDSAIADYSEALKLDRNDATAYYNRGLAYYQKKDYDSAIADYNKALKLDPNKTNAYYNRGLIYKNQGNKNKALEDFKKFLELSNDVEWNQEAKRHLQELGRF